MLNAHYASILLFLGPLDALQGINQSQILHSQFFIHSIERDQFIHIFEQRVNTVREMDIYLPNAAVDLIVPYKLQYPQKRFHLYCETDNLVDNYRGMVPDICEQVFNVNQIEKKLYKTANQHLLHSINDLEKRADEGDVDAGDLLTTIGEIFVRSAMEINDNIRQGADLPQQPAEHEEW
jgi:hypothetical protein